MIPDDKFWQSRTIWHNPASVDAVTSSKAGLSMVNKGITRVFSQQTEVASQSQLETFPVMAHWH